MEGAFWLLVALLAWCYVGYPLGMVARATLRPRPWIRRAPVGEPTVSVVVAVRNGADYLEARLDDLFGVSYPGDRLEVIVVCNGCSDRTEAIADAYARRDPRVRVLVTPPELGKAGAVNAGVSTATGEFVVLTDVRQTFHPDAMARLLEPFSDPEVGVVSGRLRLRQAEHAATEGLRWYWVFETALRRAESRTGSTVGVTGAIYALRVSVFEALPANLILDDVYVPMRAILRGARVVLADAALAFDVPSADPRQEYVRKRRTMVGNLQLIRLAPELLAPTRNPIFFRFISHKVLRLATPAGCLGMVALAGLLGGPLYSAVFWSGLALYGAGFLGLLLRSRVLAIPAAFVLMHLAIVAALVRWRQDAAAVWQSAARQPQDDPVHGGTTVNGGASSAATGPAAEGHRPR